MLPDLELGTVFEEDNRDEEERGEGRWVLLIRAANDPSVFTITKKAPTRAFSWLKVATTAFTFEALGKSSLKLY